MEELIREIDQLKENEIGKQINKRMRELKDNFMNEQSVFSELCFCITTANASSQKGIEIQNVLQGKLEMYTEETLIKKLRELGYRFHNTKGKRLIEAGKRWKRIKKTIETFENEFSLREWLVENINGFGYKEASHFLRNIGYANLAILDRHILAVMHEHKMIDKIPDSLTKRKYLELEEKLTPLCTATKLRQGELDFYLWYMRTGKVLK